MIRYMFTLFKTVWIFEIGEVCMSKVISKCFNKMFQIFRGDLFLLNPFYKLDIIWVCNNASHKCTGGVARGGWGRPWTVGKGSIQMGRETKGWKKKTERGNKKKGKGGEKKIEKGKRKKRKTKEERRKKKKKWQMKRWIGKPLVPLLGLVMSHQIHIIFLLFNSFNLGYTLIK